MLFDIIVLFFLFIFLGIMADLVVRNISYLATVIKLKLFAFGIILGLITTLPELSVGLNATLDQAASLSVGNLLGGVMVILGLVLGVSLIFNRKIVTDGNFQTIIPEMAVIFLPVILGLDGRYGLGDGLILVGAYLALIFYLFRLNYNFTRPQLEFVLQKKVVKATLLSIVGVIFIILISNLIVKTTLDLLTYLDISRFLIGLLVFAIGTNLPEIFIAIMSWKEKTFELSLSHLLAAAFTHTLVLGILAVINPISFFVSKAYLLLAVFLGVLLVLFVFFYRSQKKLDRREGFALAGVYLLFLITNLLLLV